MKEVLEILRIERFKMFPEPIGMVQNIDDAEAHESIAATVVKKPSKPNQRLETFLESRRRRTTMVDSEENSDGYLIAWSPVLLEVGCC